MKPAARTLGQRERSLLLLPGGNKTLTDLTTQFRSDAQAMVMQLVRDGYLQEVRAPAKAPVSFDAFNGKRSLATTRVFLFDICERMFVKRAPEQAEYFRQALREAMLTVRQLGIVEVGKISAQDRANSISDRVALLRSQIERGFAACSLANCRWA